MKMEKIEQIAPNRLNPAAYNPRKMGTAEMGHLRRSLREFGFVDPVIVRKQGLEIIGGHQRVKAAILERIPKVPVILLDIGRTRARALNLALNKIQGEWDWPKLTDLLKEMDASKVDLGISGFDGNELETIMAATGGLPAKPEKVEPQKLIDAAAKLQRKWRVRAGQAWLTPSFSCRGKPHRILCADSLKSNGLDGRRPDMIFSDPPWNVAIGGDLNPRHRQRALMRNDALRPAAYAKFIETACGLWARVCSGDAYIVLGSEQWPVLDKAMRDAGFHWSATIIWVKDIFVLGRSKYHRRYEPLWYGWPVGSKSSFVGSRKLDDVWEIPRPRVSPEQATMKPIQLMLRAIRNSSRRGALVYDPFLGSGSTMVAAEQAGRICAGVEIEPKFVAVCLERMANMGLKPKLVRH